MQKDFRIQFAEPEAPKNARGKLGLMCKHCDGYGFTYGLNGTSTGCHRCNQTGVEPVDTHELHNQVVQLTKIVGKMVKVMKKKGAVI